MHKNMIKMFVTLAFVSVIPVLGQGGNQLQSVAMSASHTRLEPLWFDFDSVNYVNGGITFTYPAGVFSATPRVQITIQLQNAVYNSAESYVPEITANSTLSTTVRVNRVTVGAITEAATNDVSVHVYAISNNN